MLVRNWVELAIIVILLIVGIIIYMYAKNKVSDIESNLMIRKKQDIHEKIEEVEDSDINK